MEAFSLSGKFLPLTEFWIEYPFEGSQKYLGPQCCDDVSLDADTDVIILPMNFAEIALIVYFPVFVIISGEATAARFTMGFVPGLSVNTLCLQRLCQCVEVATAGTRCIFRDHPKQDSWTRQRGPYHSKARFEILVKEVGVKKQFCTSDSQSSLFP